MIVAEEVQFPKTVSQLRKVRGIGDYTAGAIASIAFKEVSNFCDMSDSERKFLWYLSNRDLYQVVPVVDGNVVRVIARLKAVSANPKDSSTVKKFWWAFLL